MKRLAVYIAAAAACAALSIVKLAAVPEAHAELAVYTFPSTFRGLPLREIPMNAAEKRFYSGFPGEAKKFDAGACEVLVRFVTRPARELHPASECYLAAGDRIEYFGPVELSAEEIAQGKWEWQHCFVTTEEGKRYAVDESVVSVDGAHRYADVQEWYWKCAAGGDDKGPWVAVTVQTPLASCGR